MRLAGKIALITGAAGDIGRTTAVRFAQEGAVPVLSDISEEGCRRALQEAGQKGAEGCMIVADVTREDDIVSLFGRVR